MFPISETGGFSGLLPTQRPRASPKTADRQSKLGITKESLELFPACNLCNVMMVVQVINKCMFLSVFTYSSNSLTQNCEIVQLTRWAVEMLNKVFAFVWTVLLVTLTVCIRCVCNLLKFQPELCFTWRILRFGKVRKLSKCTKWSTTSAILQW